MTTKHPPYPPGSTHGSVQSRILALEEANRALTDRNAVLEASNGALRSFARQLLGALNDFRAPADRAAKLADKEVP